MAFEIVYRIKDKLTETYWNGKDFGTIGKIYVNSRLASKALTNKRIAAKKRLCNYKLVVVETRIEDQAEVFSA